MFEGVGEFGRESNIASIFCNVKQPVFPSKLHSILERSGSLGEESIISWLPSGKAFNIHNPKEFARVIMPLYFHPKTKYKSFLRQLYNYGFVRVKDRSSVDYWGYFHKSFIRGASDLCLGIQRKKIKETVLSDEERWKNVSIVRTSTKPSSNENPSNVLIDDMPWQSPTTIDQASNLTDSQTASTNSMCATLALKSLSAQLQQQVSTKVNHLEEWNYASAIAGIKSVVQGQPIVSRRGNSNTTVQNNGIDNSTSDLLPRCDSLNFSHW